MRLVLWTIALEGVCLLAFVAVVSTAWASPGKQLSMVAAVLVAALMAWLVSVNVDWQGAVRYAGMVAVGNLIVFEVLAYTRFPGLAKDMDFVSGEHMLRASVLLLLSLGGHFLLVMVARLVRRAGTLKPAT